MDAKKLALFLGIPGVGALLLAGALLSRGGDSDAPSPRKRTVAAAPAAASGATAPRAAEPERIAQATESVRVRGTYQNYRRAVATGDAALQKAILPTLLKDRSAARQYAEEDLAKARSEQDRNVARKVMEELRR